MQDQFASPCCGICRIDEPTQLCEGCLRTMNEIVQWTAMDPDQKRLVLDACQRRKDPGSGCQNLDSGGGIE